MLNEFKGFIARGNVLDLAVGDHHRRRVHADRQFAGRRHHHASGRRITGGLDFSNFFIPLSSTVTATSLVAAREQGAVFAYGNFLTVVINFLILAWIISFW